MKFNKPDVWIKFQMSSVFVLVFFFCYLLLPVNKTFAISGACSYHSGVNCSAGASYSGNVQCNDGWINSSVAFSDTDECQISYSCPSVIVSGCTTESDYQRTLNTVNQERGSARAMNASRGLLGSGMDNSSTIGQGDLDSCRNEIDIYSREVASRNQCIQDRDKASSDRAQQVEKEIESKFDAFCEDRNGRGSVYDPLSKDSLNPCTVSTYCIDTYGSNSERFGNYCVCADGYSMQKDGTKETCTLTPPPAPAENPAPTPVINYDDLAKKYGAILTPAPTQPKKSYTLQQLKDIGAKPVVPVIAPPATSTAQMPIVQTPQKKTFLQKLKSFFFGWWK